MAADTIDPRFALRERRMNLQQYGVVGLCVLINMIWRWRRRDRRCAANGG